MANNFYSELFMRALRVLRVCNIKRLFFWGGQKIHFVSDTYYIVPADKGRVATVRWVTQGRDSYVFVFVVQKKTKVTKGVGKCRVFSLYFYRFYNRTDFLRKSGPSRG